MIFMLQTPGHNKKYTKLSLCETKGKINNNMKRQFLTKHY